MEPLPSPDWAPSTILSIKRDDKLHGVISGNKARKLKWALSQWQESAPSGVASMGGNRSNYLHALGYLCHEYQIPLTVYIRGHKPEQFGPTLKDLSDWGVALEFLPKDEFQRLRRNGPGQLNLSDETSWLPEGGSSTMALSGISEAVNELTEEPDVIFVPVGTGCTALGIAHGVKQKGWNSRVIGVVVLKGATGMIDSLKVLAQQAALKWPDNLVLEHNYCGNGFGKITAEVRRQQSYFESLWQVPLEPVYTVKMCNALRGYCDSGQLDRQHVLLWHTGGLQGNR